MNATTSERVELRTSDGPMRAYVARPNDRERRAGMIVFQEAFGVNAHIRDVTERFAHLGLIAVAPELFHRSAHGFEAGYDDLEVIRPHMGQLTADGLAEDARAAFGWLEMHAQAGRIGTVGFCMGGRAAYIANSALPLRGAISFYGGGIAPNLLDLAPQQHGPLLMFWGGQDAHIPPSQYCAVADALSAAEKPHEQMLFSQAGHGFFCDARASHQSGAAAQAWALVQAFMADCGLLP